MFTVCPKCALTLVVTASDLRVAQGYVRCGRCSNVFNAIVGLSEDRSGGNAQGSGSATTSIIRKAPSIEDMPPERFGDSIPPEERFGDSIPPQERFGLDTSNSNKVTPEELFGDTVPPARFVDTVAPKKFTPVPEPPDPDERFALPEDAPTQEYTIEVPAPDLTRTTGPIKFAAPEPFAPAPAPRPAAPPSPAKKPAEPPRKDLDLADDPVPDTSLEFNPAETDVSKIFIETPTKRIDLSRITGQFEQVTAEPEPPPPPPPPAPPPRSAAPPPRQVTPPPSPRRNEDDVQLDDELRQLAARLDATGKQRIIGAEPPPKRAEKPTPPKIEAANDNARAAYAGSPYNSADDPTNVARKAAAKVIRRAPATDEAGASEAAAELTPRRMPRKQRLAWIGGSVALGVVLVAQAIHHNRNDLATNPRLNRPLTSFYSAIGAPLVPRWNLASYDVRQLGAFSAGGDNANLTVRASLQNNATQALPLPLLRITVQDRYGNRIATRDVPPKSYVPGAVPTDAHLRAGQRIDAEVTFKDPGRDAVGFEIDACLPTPEGRIACANDAVAAARR